MSVEAGLKSMDDVMPSRTDVRNRLLARRLKTNSNLLRRLNNMSIGDYEAFRIDDDAGSNSFLIPSRDVGVAAFVARAIPRHLDFYDTGRNAPGQVLDRVTELFELR